MHLFCNLFLVHESCHFTSKHESKKKFERETNFFTFIFSELSTNIFFGLSVFASFKEQKENASGTEVVFFFILQQIWIEACALAEVILFFLGENKKSIFVSSSKSSCLNKTSCLWKPRKKEEEFFVTATYVVYTYVFCCIMFFFLSEFFPQIKTTMVKKVLSFFNWGNKLLRPQNLKLKASQPAKLKVGG